MFNTREWKLGYCDALMGRPCKSLWEGWPDKLKNAKYICGYMAGEDKARELGIAHA